MQSSLSDTTLLVREVASRKSAVRITGVQCASATVLRHAVADNRGVSVTLAEHKYYAALFLSARLEQFYASLNPLLACSEVPGLITLPLNAAGVTLGALIYGVPGTRWSHTEFTTSRKELL